MLAAVLIFAVLNYALKAAGPVISVGYNLSDRLGTLIEALPPALLTGMLAAALWDNVGLTWTRLSWQALAAARLHGPAKRRIYFP
jgi:uncharacterized membrane protein